jgi:hypothetical protein
MTTILKRASLMLMTIAMPVATALASQGPGVSDGTASPALQRAVVIGFVAFFVMIALANLGRRK